MPDDGGIVDPVVIGDDEDGIVIGADQLVPGSLCRPASSACSRVFGMFGTKGS